MASYFVQAGTTIYQMSQAGVATAVTLPTTITLYGADQPCRPVLYQVGESSIIVVANGGTHDFFIDTFGTARQLQIAPPTSYPVPTAGAGTGLTGIYKVAVTFKIKDDQGQTILESGMGPLSIASPSLSNQSISVASIPVSGDPAVNARGVYRTTSGGSTLYPWFDIDNNVTLAEDRDVADSLISLLPAAAIRYGTPPNLKLIASWRDRLWGAPRSPIDHLRWTDERVFYAWSADNEIIIPPQNTDAFGVTALIPRRDALGAARRRALFQVTGTSNDSFQRIGVSESLGCVSQESVIVVDNVAYMLGDTSVNEWSDSGMRAVSDTQVSAWFNTDRVFNRALFSKAQGKYNPDTNCYELLLCGADSTDLDRWIAYSLDSRTWLGPHRTNAFTPTCTGTSIGRRGTLTNVDDVPITAFGGDDGYIYVRDSSSLLDHEDEVPFKLVLPPLSADEPDLFKFFDRPTIHTKQEEQGQLTVMALVGDLPSIEEDSPYIDAVLADVPIAYWRLEESSGLSFTDISGNSHTATLLATTGLTYQVFGALLDGSTGLALDGTQGSATFPSIVLNSSCAFEFFFVPGSTGSGYTGVLGQSGGGTGLYYMPSLQRLNMGLSGITDNYNATPLTPGTLYHVVVSLSNGIGTFYLNGVADGAFSGWTNITFNALFNVGGVAVLTSLLDEIAVYNYALTADQVATHYELSGVGQRLFHDLTLDRETLPRLGTGRYCKISLTHSSATERPRLYGLELPYNFLARR